MEKLSFALKMLNKKKNVILKKGNFTKKGLAGFAKM